MDVLIVEDQIPVRQLMRKSLERAGYMVKEAENGLEAIAMLQETPFQAIVSDIGLPFLEGKSFYDVLRTDFPDLAARVLFVTGMADDPETRRFLESTGRPFLGKPVDITEFVNAVRSVVSGTAARSPGEPKA